MSIQDLLRQAMGQENTAPIKRTSIIFDSVGNESIARYTLQDMKLKAASAVQSWCESDDLEGDETSVLRLQALLIGIIDDNKNGEIDEDEAEAFEALLNFAWDYMSSKGVDEDDIDLLLNDWDESAADRIMDLVTGSLPDEDDAITEMNNFAFSEDEDNGALFDSTFKNVMAVRHGKKMRIRKRLSGSVRLSGKQKMAIRKMHMKSHSARAMLGRMKSMRLRKKAHL